tara:strand:- start:122 stop:373 length:252 start_codon:yes stop_codon:yes gene_type:complete
MANKKPEVYDRLDALEKQVRDLKNKDNEEIKEVNFEEVLFDKEKYHVGQAKVNEKISKGFQIFRQFATESGLVIELARWRGKK